MLPVVPGGVHMSMEFMFRGNFAVDRTAETSDA
uniref:Uncharacterized protein n=1 Tax=Arundo donax TaxID=35708 RepID=A0A0A9A5E8_ARUDO